MNDLIYLDNAASTRPYDYIIKRMSEVALNYYGNPSALHTPGEGARELLEDARREIALTINAEPNEIYFTSGATEANNWVAKMIGDSRYFYCSQIEHKSVLNMSMADKRIMVKSNGVVSVGDLACVMEQRKESLVSPFVSIMYANNEVGVVQPIGSIAQTVHGYGGIFHTDATQAYTKVPIDVKREKIDLLSASGHKIHGPRGIGFLYISSELSEKMNIRPFIRGGGQEFGLRSGTENVPAIVGMAEAAKESIASMKNDQEAIRGLRDYTYELLRREVEHCDSNVNIWNDNVLPAFLNVWFEGVDAQELVVMLAERGVCVSAGSACNAGNPEPSHVLRAMEIDERVVKSSIRMTLGHDTTKTELTKAVGIIKDCVNILREYS